MSSSASREKFLHPITPAEATRRSNEQTMTPLEGAIRNVEAEIEKITSVPGHSRRYDLPQYGNQYGGSTIHGGLTLDVVIELRKLGWAVDYCKTGPNEVYTVHW